MTEVRLSKNEFSALQSYVHDTLGIWLPEGKMTMVEQRIRPLVLEAGLGSFGDFLKVKLLDQPRPEDLSAFVDRITTNHTYFARESEHFDFLKDHVLPELTEKIRTRATRGTPKTLRMWCAAASRGHEPYTLAMIQRMYFGKEYAAWDAGLLATDISDRSLKVAIDGRYPASEVNALPLDMRNQFFKRRGDEYEVVPDLRRDVTYRRFNLKNPVYRFKRPFDIVFARNVLIYFDVPTKHDVIRKIASQLNPGGYIFVGLAESLGRETGPVQYVKPGVYKKAG